MVLKQQQLGKRCTAFLERGGEWQLHGTRVRVVESIGFQGGTRFLRKFLAQVGFKCKKTESKRAVLWHRRNYEGIFLLLLFLVG
jgi:hypothetical protein